MLSKRIKTTFRAALILIATEDLNALKALLRTIANRTAKSISTQKKN